MKKPRTNKVQGAVLFYSLLQLEKIDCRSYPKTRIAQIHLSTFLESAVHDRITEHLSGKPIIKTNLESFAFIETTVFCKIHIHVL